MPHGDFGVLHHVLARRVQLRIVERKADRGRERDFLVAEHHRRGDDAADEIGDRADLTGLEFRHDQDGELIAGKPCQRILRFQNAG